MNRTVDRINLFQTVAEEAKCDAIVVCTHWHVINVLVNVAEDSYIGLHLPVDNYDCFAIDLNCQTVPRTIISAKFGVADDTSAKFSARDMDGKIIAESDDEHQVQTAAAANHKVWTVVYKTTGELDNTPYSVSYALCNRLEVAPWKAINVRYASKEEFLPILSRVCLAAKCTINGYFIGDVYRIEITRRRADRPLMAESKLEEIAQLFVEFGAHDVAPAMHPNNCCAVVGKNAGYTSEQVEGLPHREVLKCTPCTVYSVWPNGEETDKYVEECNFFEFLEGDENFVHEYATKTKQERVTIVYNNDTSVTCEYPK